MFQVFMCIVKHEIKKRDREKKEEWNKVNTMSICLQAITKYSESCFVLLKSRNRSLYIVKKKN